jgi:hypothetical protein
MPRHLARSQLIAFPCGDLEIVAYNPGKIGNLPLSRSFLFFDATIM